MGWVGTLAVALISLTVATLKDQLHNRVQKFIQENVHMATIYYDADANIELIQQKRIAVIGYAARDTPTPSICKTPVAT